MPSHAVHAQVLLDGVDISSGAGPGAHSEVLSLRIEPERFE